MEMIVVLGSFAILAIISTSTLFIALSNMAKAKVTREVRRNGDSALQIMERHLRVAQALPTPVAVPPPVYQCGGNRVDYIDQYGQAGRFTCVTGVPPQGNFIASGSADIPITDQSKVSVENCNFTCDSSDPRKWVQIDFSLISIVNPNSTRPTEKQRISWKSQLNLRFE